jgi:hypothetical protein
MQTYNPVTSATRQTFLLNETEMAQITIGMTRDQVHKIMGDSITIGYSQEQPLTIHNPYKTEDLKIKEEMYLVEQYVVRINKPDGFVTDDELMPLIFNKGKLVGKGKDYLKTLR